MRQDGNPHGAASVALLTALAAVVTELVQSNSVNSERLKVRLKSWLSSPEITSLSGTDRDMMKMVSDMLITTICNAEKRDE